jgi:putative oxidoreductase
MSTARHVQPPFMSSARSFPSAPARRGIVELALSVGVAAVFLYAGALKVWDPVTFAGDINNYRILPYAFSTRLAFYLPWLEILCAVALISGRLATGATALLAGMTVVFIGATAAAKIRGIDLNCGCFGKAGENFSFTWHMVLLFALLGALVMLWRVISRRDSARATSR